MSQQPSRNIPKVGYREFKHNSGMQDMRDQFGLGHCIVEQMDLFKARQKGQRSLLSSNTTTEDVITGRCYDLDFMDVLGNPADKELEKLQPHVEVKDSISISPIFNS